MLLVLLCLAVVVASPASWFFMKGWLQNFAYRIGLSALFFLLAGLSAVAIAVLTTSYLTVRAARANPADSLRYE